MTLKSVSPKVPSQSLRQHNSHKKKPTLTSNTNPYAHSFLWRAPSNIYRIAVILSQNTHEDRKKLIGASGEPAVLLEFQLIYIELLCILLACSRLGQTLPPSVHHMAQLGTVVAQFLDLWLWINIWQPTCGEGPSDTVPPSWGISTPEEGQIHLTWLNQRNLLIAGRFNMSRR